MKLLARLNGTPWNAEWRSWFYAFAWMSSAVSMTLFSIWLVYLVRYNWPADRAEQQLSILATALYMIQAGILLTIAGLNLRNAIRNIKLSGGKDGFVGEASGFDQPTQMPTTTKTTTITETEVKP